MSTINQQRGTQNQHRESGYSLVELIISLVLTLIILGIAVTTFSSALSSRTRESSTADGITSTQAALNIMSREIGNAGYGLSSNGIVLTDSGAQILRVRANVSNEQSAGNGGATSGAGEDVTFYFDSSSQSVVRFDANPAVTSGVINRVSSVTFEYHDDSNGTSGTTPTAATSRVRILLTVTLPDVQGQPANRSVQVKSDVTLRNSPYHLSQY